MKIQIDISSNGYFNLSKLKNNPTLYIKEKAHRFISSTILLINQYLIIQTPFFYYHFNINNKNFTHLLTVTYRPSFKIEHIETLTEKEISLIYKENLKNYNKIKNGLHRLRTALKKHKQKISYLAVFEPHQSLFIHSHILIYLPPCITNKNFEDIINYLSKIFQTSPQGIDLKYIYNQSEAINYISKYLKKTSLKRFKKKSNLIELNKNFITSLLPRQILKSSDIKAIKKSFKIIKKTSNNGKIISYITHKEPKTVKIDIQNILKFLKDLDI